MAGPVGDMAGAAIDPTPATRPGARPGESAVKILEHRASISPGGSNRNTHMPTCLYLTETKPSRKNARLFADWLKDNHPDCTFTEVNAEKQTYPATNGGRYLGRVEGPDTMADDTNAASRQAVFEAARRLLVA